MIQVKRKIHFRNSDRGRKRISDTPSKIDDVPLGRITRVSRLMALAIRLERMLQTREVSDIHELARLSHVTQPRMSQILALTLLAPDIQDELLFLPRVTAGKSAIHEKMLRPISAEIDWTRQREMWEEIKAT